MARVICGWGVGIEVHGSWGNVFQKPWAAWAMEEHVYCTHSLQGCFSAAGLNIYLPPTPTTAQHAPSHFIPPVCRSIASSRALFASSLLFCNQSAQVANPRLLLVHMADLCFSIPFASCCFSFSLVLQAAVDHHVLWKYLDLFLLGGTQSHGFAARCKD